DGPVARHLLEREARRGGELVRREAGAAERSRRRHGEAACVSGGDQLLRVGADAVLEPRRERVLRVLEHAALGRDGALALLEIAAPGGRCGAFHETVSCGDLPQVPNYAARAALRTGSPALRRRCDGAAVLAAASRSARAGPRGRAPRPRRPRRPGTRWRGACPPRTRGGRAAAGHPAPPP